MAEAEDKYIFWDEHIKYVVQEALVLARKYNADTEIVEHAAIRPDDKPPRSRRADYDPRRLSSVRSCFVRTAPPVGVSLHTCPMGNARGQGEGANTIYFCRQK